MTNTENSIKLEDCMEGEKLMYKRLLYANIF